MAFKKSTGQLLTKTIFSLLLAVIIPFEIMLCYNQGEMVTGWIALLAVVVALFGKQLISWYVKPEIEVTVSNNVKYLHEVDAEYTSDGVTCSNKQLWLGLMVENTGLVNAGNVMVYFTGIKSNVLEDFEKFTSVPMATSWVHSPIIKTLHPGVPIRWDVCYMVDFAPIALNFSFFKTPLDLIQIECEHGHTISFEFEVAVVSDNNKPKKVRIKLEYNGEYTSGVNVKIIS